MSTARVTVLGSGTIVPDAKRKATSIMVQNPGGGLLLDCGPGAADGMEKAGASYRSINRIFLTHYHADHTLGLVRIMAAMNSDAAGDPDRPLFIAGPPGLKRFIGSLEGVYPSIAAGARLELTEMEAGDEVSFDGFKVTAGEARHGKGPALAYRISTGEADLVYTGDTDYFEGLAGFAGSAGLILCECSFPDTLARDGHMTPSLAGRLARSAGAARLILIHMYPVFSEDPAKKAAKIFSGKVDTAFDGMTVDL